MFAAKLKPVCFIVAIVLLGIRADVWGAGKLPNIVIIYADDVGYGDLSCYNTQAAYKTPVLDRMAAEGLRFLDGHSACTVCSPSRYALLSGKQPYRGPGTGVFSGAGGPSMLKANEKTLPQMLKSKGYRTGIFGKWHVGLTWNDSSGQRITSNDLTGVRSIDYSRSTPLVDGPNARGFDKSFITACCPLTDFLYAYIVDGMVPVKPTFLSRNDTFPNYDGRWRNDFRQGWTATNFNFEGIDWVFLSQARNFVLDHMKNYPSSPFFMELATTVCHAPVLPRRDMIGRTGKAGARGDFMYELDTIVGEVFKTLTTLGIDSNTIVLFSADNGAENFHVVYMREYYNHDPVRPWRGFKRDCWEGGHRVPVIVRWPGKIPAGKVTNQMFNQTDIFATLASIVGYTLPDSEATDSWDMYPVLLGLQPENKSVRNILLTQTWTNNFFEIRQGKWKYIDGQGSGGNNYTDPLLAPYAIADPTGAPAQLYDLDADPGEIKNLYYTDSVKRKELKDLLEQSKKSGRSAPTGRTPFNVPTGCTNPDYKEGGSLTAIRAGKAGYHLQGFELYIDAPGYHRIGLFNTAGRLQLSRSGRNRSSYRLNRLLGKGLYLVRVQTGFGIMTQKLAVY